MKLLQKFKGAWQPKPIDPPTLDPDLAHLGALTRSAESIRYSILSFEFWVSPNGQVREWFRQNARIASWLAIPGLLVLPVAGSDPVPGGEGCGDAHVNCWPHGCAADPRIRGGAGYPGGAVHRQGAAEVIHGGP